MTETDYDPIMPPIWVPLPELPRWLQDIHGLTEADAWSMLLHLRTWPFHFRVSYGAGKNEILVSWNGWDVKDWKIGRAHWEDDPPDIDYPLGVSWDAVVRAVRLRRERERQALPPPVPPGHVDVAGGMEAATSSRRSSIGGRPLEFDWMGFARELIRLANTLDGLPDRAATTEHMKKWCAEKWGREPSDSMVRGKIALLHPDAS